MPADYYRKHRPISNAEASRLRELAVRGGQNIVLVDPVEDEKWARTWRDVKRPSDYFEYFFSGQDIKVRMAEIPENDTRFGDLPIASLQFQVEQEKQPIYGFWDYCVDSETEALTQRGWVSGYDITTDDVILSMDPGTQELVWSPVREVYRNLFDGLMHQVTGSGIDALVTPGHRFVTCGGELKPIGELRRGDRLQLMGTALQNETEVYTDAFVELIGWFATKGHIRGDTKAFELAQSATKNPDKLDRIELCLKRLNVRYRRNLKKNGVVQMYVGVRGPQGAANDVPQVIVDQVLTAAPNRVPTYAFLMGLSTRQRRLLLDTLIDGDGWRPKSRTRQYGQNDVRQVDVVAALCALLGIPTTVARAKNGYVTLTMRDTMVCQGYGVDLHGGWVDGRYNTRLLLLSPKSHQPTQAYQGSVWCPKTDYGTFVCRRGGKVYVTGNTYSAVMRGTRLVTGQIALYTKYPNFMMDLLSQAATNRASATQIDNYGYPSGLTEDDKKIEQYWGRNLFDSGIQAQAGRHMFSVHPPFSLVIQYGLQPMSVSKEATSAYEQWYVDYYENRENEMMTDLNHRLLKDSDPSFENRLVIDGIELRSCSRQYMGDGSPLGEVYSFFARDVIVPTPPKPNSSTGGEVKNQVSTPVTGGTAIPDF